MSVARVLRARNTAFYARARVAVVAAREPGCSRRFVIFSVIEASLCRTGLRCALYVTGVALARVAPVRARKDCVGRVVLAGVVALAACLLRTCDSGGRASASVTLV